MNDLFCLKGKIAIVTGALGLIGQKHCIALNNAGAHVIVTDLDEQKCIDFVWNVLIIWSRWMHLYCIFNSHVKYQENSNGAIDIKSL